MRLGKKLLEPELWGVIISKNCVWYISHLKRSKVVRRQAEVVQGVPGRLRPRIILTFRHYRGGRSSAKRTGHLYPRRNPWYSLSEAETTSGHMVLSGIPRKKYPLTPPGIDPWTVRLVAQRLNHSATPGSDIFLIIYHKYKYIFLQSTLYSSYILT